MKLLVIDDEEGIRDGLASFLRHHGHDVYTAASVAEGAALLAAHTFAVMVTDWRLTDGNAQPLLAQAAARALPALVITGCPEEIAAGAARVLRKPVPPDALLAHIAALHETAALPRAHDPLALLPVDVQDRIRLLLHGVRTRGVAIDDDGTFVTVTVDTSDGALPDPTLVQHLGGDWAVLPAAGDVGCRGRWRCYRDGRPESVHTVIGPHDAWPRRGGPIGVDLHAHPLTPRELLALLDAVGQARAQGHHVHLLNVPSHLRLWLELVGRAHELPMRTCSGPRLAATARQLWS
jgi:CheY-like chemotaxis protein